MQTEKDIEYYKSSILPKKNKNAPSVLYYLFMATDGKMGVKVSYPKISRDLGISPRTVASCIDMLVDDKAILRYTRPDGNVYVVNSALYWDKSRVQKENCAFNYGGIVNDLTEQDPDLDRHYQKSMVVIPLQDIADHQISIIKDIK